MNIRQFIQAKKEQHSEKRAQQLQQAMEQNKKKLARAEQENAYRLQKEKLRQMKKASTRLKYKPAIELAGKAKKVVNRIQQINAPKKTTQPKTKTKTVKIVFEEPTKKEEPKTTNVWRQ